MPCESLLEGSFYFVCYVRMVVRSSEQKKMLVLNFLSMIIRVYGDHDRQLVVDLQVSISSFSRDFTVLFHGFQGFCPKSSTLATTDLVCSRQSRHVAILRTFIVYGVSEAQSSIIDLPKKVHLFSELFLCFAPSKIAHKRTGIFHGFQGFQGSGTDQFYAMQVMVMTCIATPARHELRTSIWNPWSHERPAKSGRRFRTHVRTKLTARN
jgi:hypothetical protein